MTEASTEKSGAAPPPGDGGGAERVDPAGRGAPDPPAAPRSPTDLGGRSWWGIARRAASEFQQDNLTDWAAALTYYAILSLFPGLIVLVAMLGLLGEFPRTFDALLDIVRHLGPGAAVDTLAGPIEEVIRRKAAAGTLLGFGLLAALWSASGYIGAF